MKIFNFKKERGETTAKKEDLIVTAEETKVPEKKVEAVKSVEKKAQRRVRQTKVQTVDSAEAYRDAYLRKNKIRKRHSVYISEEMFAYYADVARVITHNEIPVGAYIDNVLRGHKNMHDESLDNLYLQEHERMKASRSRKSDIF